MPRHLFLSSLPNFCRLHCSFPVQLNAAYLLCLQSLSKRIHYGKFVAEAKFRASPVLYEAAIRAQVYCHFSILPLIYDFLPLYFCFLTTMVQIRLFLFSFHWAIKQLLMLFVLVCRTEPSYCICSRTRRWKQISRKE